MTMPDPSDSETVTQLSPEESRLPLKGLYLDQRLAEIAAKLSRPLVLTNYVTDRSGVIAVMDENRRYRVPTEIKNKSDWRLFQELMAQADVVISGSAYIKRFLALGSQAEDVLFQFEPGKEFAQFGEWRLNAGYKKRSPDLAFVVRSLDFQFPDELVGSGRRITIFTTYAEANSDLAKALTKTGAAVIGAGESGVDGNQLIDSLGEMGCRVMMMATGPSVLDILLKAQRLDLLYVTEVQKEIPFTDPLSVITLLTGGQRVDRLDDFSLHHRYIQERVVTEDGSAVSQVFLRYDRKGILTY
jgi:riboflavin biosynthesis pyrimidine reductase